MNKKGFVLVETIVVSVFVLGLFTFIIANIIPLIGEYEKESDYDSVESIYSAHMIRKMILKSENQRIASLATLPAEGYYMFDGDDICYYLTNINYCKKLLSRDFLDVRKIILTNYTISNDFKQRSKKFDRATREYISQMQKYNNTGLNPSQYDFERRIIVVFNDGRITNIELLFNRD